MKDYVGQDRIEKQVELKASVARVWNALTDSKQFGEWFGVKLTGHFQLGKPMQGKILYPGYKHLKWEIVIQKIEHQRVFSFTWHPYAVDPNMDYSKETPTLVEFTLEPSGAGTTLTLTESGFDKIPHARRLEAFQKNESGWVEQMKNIAKYVSEHHHATAH